MHIPSVARLLIVDDEAAQMTALCDTLEHEGLRFTVIDSSQRTVRKVRVETLGTKDQPATSSRKSP